MDKHSRLIRPAREILLPLLLLVGFATIVQFVKLAWNATTHAAAEYRNVTVEFLDPQVTTYGYRYETGKYDYGAVALNPPVDPEGHFVNSLDLERAEAEDVQLLPHEKLSPGTRPALAIAVTSVSVADGPDRQITLKPGEVAWLESANAVLVNNGPGRARFALVVLKPTDGKY